ncbi:MULTISPECIES: YgjP-like metallopeptidase domain-containing protein [unclassified Endozoicomonas]|uniref:YgjP-like metallopeptidase domain-containing protein n=1 Tax=unclassified Endozoicomonas TaxID=2644528 RepID=UPI003BB7C3E0
MEYIVVHEVVHLHPFYNERFKQLMTHYMLNWRSYRDELNSLPVQYEDWGY